MTTHTQQGNYAPPKHVSLSSLASEPWSIYCQRELKRLEANQDTENMIQVEPWSQSSVGREAKEPLQNVKPQLCFDEQLADDKLTKPSPAGGLSAGFQAPAEACIKVRAS